MGSRDSAQLPPFFLQRTVSAPSGVSWSEWFEVSWYGDRSGERWDRGRSEQEGDVPPTPDLGPLAPQRAPLAPNLRGRLSTVAARLARRAAYAESDKEQLSLLLAFNSCMIREELRRTGGTSMPNKTRGRAIATYIASCLLVGSPAFGDNPGLSLSGAVETIDGERVPHVEVRITNVKGAETSDTGEFEIRGLPPKIQPGWPIVLDVKKWIVTDPYIGQRGRMFMPNPQVVVEPFVIKVTRPGDRRLLAAASVKSLLEEAASILDLKHVPDGNYATIDF